MATRRDAVEARHLGGDRLAIRVRGHELFADQPVGQERYAAAWRRELASLPPEDGPADRRRAGPAASCRR